jgi:hypothetical protein
MGPGLIGNHASRTVEEGQRRASKGGQFTENPIV